jgi:hypothetical protein
MLSRLAQPASEAAIAIARIGIADRRIRARADCAVAATAIAFDAD